MTEGHAAHGIALRLRQLVGHPVRSSSPAGLFDAGAFDLATVGHAEAVGKHLLVHFADVAPVVHVHLAIRGRWSVRRHRRALVGDFPRTEPPVGGRVGWRLLTRTFHAELIDPRVCEVLDADGVLALRSRLGPDPLRGDARPDDAIARLRRSTRPIAVLLLDQSVVAGIGNVYRAELLHRARQHPFTPGAQVPPERLDALWNDAVRLMRVGLAAGQIVTDPHELHVARDHLVRGEPVPRTRRTYAVYGRAGRPCRTCGATVQARRLGLQRVFWCPGCQPPGPQDAGTARGAPRS